MAYVGRFAPSPTGPLHLGSLLAALSSALDAAYHDGTWLLRIEDLDPQRCQPQFERQLLAQLAAHGLIASEHDCETSADATIPPKATRLRQSTRSEIYRQALDELKSRGLIFPCDCSRKILAQQTEACCERDCRRRQPDLMQSALRADFTALESYQILDRSLGPIIFDPKRHRDVVVWRRDGIAAYHLAVVVDDAAQGVTDVVRGSDLASSVPWQTALQRLLGLPTPRYLHLPVLTDADGTKLSKRDHAAPLADDQAITAIRQALAWLRQPQAPNSLALWETIRWAAEHWQPQRFAGVVSVAYQ